MGRSLFRAGRDSGPPLFFAFLVGLVPKQMSTQVDICALGLSALGSALMDDFPAGLTKLRDVLATPTNRGNYSLG